MDLTVYYISFYTMFFVFLMFFGVPFYCWAMVSVLGALLSMNRYDEYVHNIKSGTYHDLWDTA